MRTLAQYEWLIMLLGPFFALLYVVLRDERQHRRALKARAGSGTAASPDTKAS